MDMEERLEALEDAMWHASEMIEALKRIGGYEDIIDALEDTSYELEYAADEAEKEVDRAGVCAGCASQTDRSRRCAGR